jgi:NAD(P)-dependent dehydrogenase (short-subunit alcohol dehydrogenase family)
MAQHQAKPSVALSDAAIVITGGTSGIGLETAMQFIDAGARKVAINGRNAERGGKARDAIRARATGADVLFVQGDMGRTADAETLARQAVERFGRIDVLVTCAGGNHAPRLFHETPIEQVASTASDYLDATLHACRAALPAMMVAGGAIINVASDAAKFPTPGESVIGAAMAGIAMFSRTLAMEAKRSGIRVNAVTPSLVADTMTYARVTEGGFSAKLFEKAAKAAHLGIAEPRDLAALIVFLASPQAARLTGQVISVNGGISAG